MDRKWVLIGAGAVVVGLATWFTLRPSEEDRVRQTVVRFVKANSVKPDDNVLSRMGRLRSELKETVADDVSVDVAELNVRVRGRNQLAESATQVGLAYQSADCELSGLVIKIDPASTTAKVDGTAIVTGTRGGERKIDRRDVHFLLFKDGAWKITTIDVALPHD